MTWFEFRAGIILWVAKLLNIKMRDLYDSYPYNPYSKTEIEEALNKSKSVKLHIDL